MFYSTCFLKGFILGFTIAAAVGPIALLCIRKALNCGRLPGMISGAGAALADGLFGIIAAFGLSIISNFLLSLQYWLSVCGGLFLVYLGVKIFREKIELKSVSINCKSLFSDFFTTFLLALTNPITILAFLAAFAGLGIAQTAKTSFHSSLLVIGVFLGSSMWWVILNESVHFFRKKITLKTIVRINKISGFFITSFGLFIFIKALI